MTALGITDPTVWFVSWDGTDTLIKLCQKVLLTGNTDAQTVSNARLTFYACNEFFSNASFLTEYAGKDTKVNLLTIFAFYFQLP